jgi:hypothetical protein
MVDKLHSYEGFLGRLHAWREGARTQWCAWKEEHCGRFKEGSGVLFQLFRKKPVRSDPQQDSALGRDVADYSHVFR